MIYKDRIILASFSGLLSALLANLTLYLINLWLPGKNINMPELTVEIFLNIHNYTNVHIVLGLIWSTVVGGIYALAYLIALDLTGWKNLWLKSIIVISGLWLVGAGTAIKMMGLAEYVRDEPLSILAFYVAHLFFASYLFAFVKRYGKK